MRISAIIPAYNASLHLERAVDSLLATHYQDLEVVVVDDGSTDSTWDIARALAEQHVGRVLVCHHPQRANRGVSASRNLGIERSSGDVICFLDADDFVYPHRFDTAVGTLVERPEVDGVYDVCELVFQDEASRAQWWTDERFFGFPQPIPPNELLFALLRGKCWATSAILIRRSLLERTGTFDPRLRIAEDCHLWFRMACVGQLVAGDLSRPVSAYRRWLGSAYKPEPRQRLHMIRAMCSFLRWMRVRDPADARLPAVEHWIAEYILGGMIEARSRSDHGFARSLAFGSARWFPRIVCRRRYWGNLWRSALGV